MNHKSLITKREKEKLKDILIDHVYDFCFNEIVQRIESDGIELTYDDPKLLNNPEDKALLEQIKRPKSFRGYYTTRETEYCNIIRNENKLPKTLNDKLKLSGFSRKKSLIKNISSAQEFLIARSYFSKNRPIEDEVKLTEKGIRHYLDGKSFEDIYVQRRNSNIAIIISSFSIIIALIALFKS